MSDHMRDMRHGTERRRWKVHVYVVGRHRWRGLSIDVCRKGVVETVGERPKEKKMNVHDG